MMKEKLESSNKTVNWQKSAILAAKSELLTFLNYTECNVVKLVKTNWCEGGAVLSWTKMMKIKSQQSNGEIRTPQSLATTLYFTVVCIYKKM